MSLTKKISIDQINSFLNNVKSKTDLLSIETDLEGVSVQLRGLNSTTLGAKVNETVSGIQSITSTVQELENDIVTPPRIARINSSIPGLETKLTVQATGSSSLSLITGNSFSSTGNLNEIITLSTPTAINNSLSLTIGAEAPPAVLSQIGSEDYSPELDVNVLSAQISENVNSFNVSLSASLGNNLDLIGTLKVASSNVGDVFKNELSVITNGSLNDRELSIATDLALVNRKNLLIEFVITKSKINKVDDPIILKKYDNLVSNYDDDITWFEQNLTEVQNDVVEIEPSEDIDQISDNISSLDVSVSNVVRSSGSTSTNITERSTPVSELGADEQQWESITNNSQPNGTSSTSLPYSFTYVNSYEELISDLRASTREITEVVIHWSAHYIDQGHVGAEELHQIALSREFSGCSYHYVIKRDGSLQRGRPINIQGDHALENGHNSYSIGLCLIGGYNCMSGTPNRERYVSAESITAEQWNTMNQFIGSFYEVWPGGQVWGHNDTDPENKVDPGIDVSDYIFRKFGKVNISESGLNPPLTLAQISTGVLT